MGENGKPGPMQEVEHLIEQETEKAARLWQCMPATGEERYKTARQIIAHICKAAALAVEHFEMNEDERLQARFAAAGQPMPFLQHFAHNPGEQTAANFDAWKNWLQKNDMWDGPGNE